MLEFFKSDLGKITAAGIIAVLGPGLSITFAWLKDAITQRASIRKKCEHISTLICIELDEFITGCLKVATDPMSYESDGNVWPTVKRPSLNLREIDKEHLNGDLIIALGHLNRDLAACERSIHFITSQSGEWDSSAHHIAKEGFSKMGLEAIRLRDVISLRYARGIKRNYEQESRSFLETIDSVEAQRRELRERVEASRSHRRLTMSWPLPAK